MNYECGLIYHLEVNFIFSYVENKQVCKSGILKVVWQFPGLLKDIELKTKSKHCIV